MVLINIHKLALGCCTLKLLLLLQLRMLLKPFIGAGLLHASARISPGPL